MLIYDHSFSIQLNALSYFPWPFFEIHFTSSFLINTIKHTHTYDDDKTKNKKKEKNVTIFLCLIIISKSLVGLALCARNKFFSLSFLIRESHQHKNKLVSKHIENKRFRLIKKNYLKRKRNSTNKNNHKEKVFVWLWSEPLTYIRFIIFSPMPMLTSRKNGVSKEKKPIRTRLRIVLRFEILLRYITTNLLRF